MADPDGGAPAPIAAAPGNENAAALATAPFSLAKIVSLKVLGDHALLRDNETDLRPSGQPYPVPHFSYGKRAAALSLEMGWKIRVEVGLELWPYEAPVAKVNLVGTAWGLTFSAALEVKGGTQTVMLESTAETPKQVGFLSGDFELEVRPDGQPAGQKAEHAWGFQIFDTVGKPRDLTTTEEAGITTKRMLTAVQRVAPFGLTEPHAVVAALFALVPGYVLVQAKPQDVPLIYNHPTYQRNGQGGAWYLDPYLKYFGECQAICRWVQALVATLGIQGTGSVVVVWADPADGPNPPAKVAALGSGGLGATSRTVGGEMQAAALVDGHCVVSGVYQTSNSNAPDYRGLNNFEACFKFEANGVTKFYGGGAGVYTSKDEVILAFYALVWVADAGPDKVVVREVVHRWRDAAGGLIP